jgi:thiamine biosynthesis lipoprotein
MTAMDDRFIRHAFTAFGGARCEVMVCGGRDGDVSSLVADTYAFERRLTRFDPGSELSQFNAAAGARVPVSALLGELLRTCFDAYHLSGGLVNAACLQALINAGYDRSITRLRRHPVARARTPPHPVIPPLPDVLEVGDGWARLARGWAVDLGGVGKGWLADTLCERFENAAINLGGDVRARGVGAEGAGWSVTLCDGTTVLVRDAGIATSGTSGRRWPGGHHLIDPRTGAPAQTAITAISVVALSALQAEVLAKGACLMGSAAAPEWLRTRGAARHAFVLDLTALAV